MSTRTKTTNTKELSVTAKRAILGLVILLSLAGLTVWAATGFGLFNKDGGIQSFKNGTEEIGQIIQNQADLFQKNKKEINDNLTTQLKSQALLLPEGLLSPDEQPSSILYPNSVYQKKGIQAELKKIEFYQKTTAAYLQVSLTSEQDIFLNAALGSVLSQVSSPEGPQITYQPLFQNGTPAKLDPRKPLDILVLFYPVNPRQKFDLVLGDFLTDQDPNLAQHFDAHFSIDPAQMLKTSAPKNRATKPSDNDLVEPIK